MARTTFNHPFGAEGLIRICGRNNFPADILPRSTVKSEKDVSMTFALSLLIHGTHNHLFQRLFFVLRVSYENRTVGHKLASFNNPLSPEKIKSVIIRLISTGATKAFPPNTLARKDSPGVHFDALIFPQKWVWQYKRLFISFSKQLEN